MNTLLVTILIPVYNGANYLTDAIESALSQTYPHVEVLVVDDGSTDQGATAAIMASYGNRIRTLYKPNGGVASALNAGIAAMKGQVLSWLSHDDIYAPEKIAVQVEAMRRHGETCVVYGPFHVMDAGGRRLHTVGTEGAPSPDRPLDAVFDIRINGCTLLVPKEVFDRVGPFEPGLPTTQDYHMWYHMARVVPFVHTPEALVSQRVHPDQGSREAGHLIEASRLFAHLLEITPPELMSAYEGSSVAFLRKRLDRLRFYPGVAATIGLRLRRHLDRIPRTLVILMPRDDAETAARLETLARHNRGAALLIVTALPLKEGAFLWILAERLGAPLVAPDALVEAVADSEVCVFISINSPAGDSTGLIALQALILRCGTIAAPDSGAAATWGVATRGPARNTVAAALMRDPGLDADALGRTGVPLVRFDPAAMPLAEESLLHAAPQLPSPEPLPHASEMAATLSGLARMSFHPRLEDGIIATLRAEVPPDTPVVLYVIHRVGGGAHVHLRDLITAMGSRARAIILQGGGDDPSTLDLVLHPTEKRAGISFGTSDHAALIRVLRAIPVCQVDVHSVFGFEDTAEKAISALGLPWDVTLIDYALIARHPHLCGEDGRFVGEKALKDRNTAVLRSRPSRLLLRAERAIALSADVAQRYKFLLPYLPVVLPQDFRRRRSETRTVFAPRPWPGEELRILLLGPMHAHKGRDILLETAALAARRRLPVHFHVIGPMAIPFSERHAVAETLTVHDPVRREDLAACLGAVSPHIGWLPAQAPETWCYALTDMMEISLPIAASRLGALTERCHGRPLTYLLPWNSTAEDWLDLFLRLHCGAAAGILPPQAEGVAEESGPRSPPTAFYFEDYLAPARRFRETWEAMWAKKPAAAIDQ